MAYGLLHLLGLPAEIRVMIWHRIYEDILDSTEGQTYEQRLSCWKGLAGTSVVIHEEISGLWPRTMIPYYVDSHDHGSYQRVTNLVTGLPNSLFHRFRHLALELPIHPEQDAKQFYQQVAAGLQKLAPVLQELRIHFLGRDRSQPPTNHQGCGLVEYPEHLGCHPALLKEDLCHCERGPLIGAIQKLVYLRRLTLSNVNYPLLQALIGTKPWLESLQLTSDSRSQLCKIDGVPLYKWQPPAALKTLVLSANAVWGAVNMTSSVLGTLQSLTFLVPSTRWQARCNRKWLDEVGQLLRMISHRGKSLRQFRLCIEQQLQEKNAANLVGALKWYLPSTGLEVLEIHATIYSDYFGSELLLALPPTLRRLYISQELIQVEDLVAWVDARYFGSPSMLGPLNSGLLGFVTYAFWDRESSRLSLLRMNAALLDRERNIHLLQEINAKSHRFGGSAQGFLVPERSLLPLRIVDLGQDTMSREVAPEAALTLYQDKAREHITVAEMVFHAEEPARAEDRMPLLVVPDFAQIGKHEHWMTDSETSRPDDSVSD